MDWSNERYVRLYIRNTTTTRRIGWEGRLVLWSIMREADRAGVIDLGGEDASDVVAAFGEMPEEIARTGLDRLVTRGVVVIQGGKLVLPNFLEAQETPQSDAQRQRESRARRRKTALQKPEDDVTKRDDCDTKRDRSSLLPSEPSDPDQPSPARAREKGGLRDASGPTAEQEFQMTEAFDAPETWWAEARGYNWGRDEITRELVSFKLRNAALERKRRSASGWLLEWRAHVHETDRRVTRSVHDTHEHEQARLRKAPAVPLAELRIVSGRQP